MNAELEEFAHLAPTPDRIVYVKAPIDALVERATSRPDRRRQLAGRDRDVIEQSLRRATSLFDGLAATPSLRDRVIIVDGSDGTLDDDRQLMALADELRSTRSSLDEHHGSMHHDGGRR